MVSTGYLYDDDKSYDDLKLKKDLLQSLYRNKIPKIEKNTFLPLISGRDAIIRFDGDLWLIYSILTLQRVDTNITDTQALILTPSLNKAVSIDNMVKRIGIFLAVESRLYEERKLVAQIVIGTPSQISKAITKGDLNTNRLLVVVVDMVDGILMGGNKNRVYSIMRHVGYDVQIVVSGCELSPDSLGLEFVRKFLRRSVTCNMPQFAVVNRHFVANVGDGTRKFEVLLDLYGSVRISRAIIFCCEATRVVELAESMRERGFVVSFIHKGMDSETIDREVELFTSCARRVLITDDHCCHLIGHTVSLVINYDLPDDVSVYGPRTVFADTPGIRGTVISFATGDEIDFIRELEEHYDTAIHELSSDTVSSL